MSKRKSIIIMLVVFLTVGFAAVSTTLVINGLIGIGENKDDFDVIFTDARLDGNRRSGFISEDKKHIQFKSNVLKNLNDTSVLEYEVTNTSRNYDANVSVTCTAGENKHIKFSYEPEEMLVEAGKKKTGTLTAIMKSVVEENQEVDVVCTLTATAENRTSMGEEYVEQDIDYLAPVDENGFYHEYLEFEYGSLEKFDNLYNTACGENGENYDSEECQAFLNENDVKIAEYMKQYENYTFLWNDIDKTTVETITFVDNNNVPENALQSWDASHKHNGSIIAYTLDGDNDGLFEICIGQNGGVVANPVSAFLFDGFAKVTNINDLNILDTSNVIDMSRLFSGCKVLNLLDLSNFDTSKVISMASMFDGCNNLSKVDLSSFDTKNVINMGLLFAECFNLSALDLSNFDTSNVTNMFAMFHNCSSLLTINLDSFNTINAINMNGMFYGCSGLVSLDVSSFNTSNVTDMGSMFNGCSNLRQIDVSNFFTSKVTNMRAMFSGCESLTKLDVSSFNTSNVTDMSFMFTGCDGLTILNLSNFNTSELVNSRQMFYRLSNLTEIDLRNFDPSKITDVLYMFERCSDSIKIKVKDEVVQEWIIGLSSTDRPSSWTTENIIIAS